MGFGEYLVEDRHSKVDETLKMLNLSCKPYIKAIRKLRGPFLRGTRRPGKIVKGLPMYIKSTRSDRTLLGTPDDLFKITNKILKANGHLPRDENVALATSEVSNDGFGTKYAFFPIGPLNYSWVLSEDFNFATPTSWMSDFYNGNSDDFWFDFDGGQSDSTIGVTEAIISNIKKYIHTNVGMNIAYKNEYEIWFKCKKYYLLPLNSDEFVDINDRLMKGDF